MSTNDGGPAFPATSPLTIDQSGALAHKKTGGGMSLRDYFAAAALTGLIASNHPLWNKEGGINITEQKAVTQGAYDIADAMLEARKP